eukprot:NODE_4776_length_1020_cov_88.147157_g4571_i0.p1 GENE.NODE_4776_length_1020_cov_88.147157_g4571_i0~~NODE_4776_length_1020_cov_88.147157_g4571_i0.p1  ORF type:complete len:325 (+),score=35.92 NODE_4776_length_1020_cov_88.147157_g4571_i0:72-977(+)
MKIKRLAHGTYAYTFVSIPGRLHKRHELPPVIPLRVPPSPTAFNFNKAAVAEHMLWFTQGTTEDDGGWHCEAPTDQTRHDHLLLINRSPIGYLSGVLVPNVAANHPQWLTASALDVALAFASELRSRGLRIGYNSMGAGASVNHMHFQIWDFNEDLPVDLAPRRLVKTIPAGQESLKVHELTEEYPVRTLVFTHGSTPALRATTRAILLRCVAYMETHGIPHDLVLTSRPRGNDVYLFPRKRGWREGEYSFIVGFPEVAGYVIMQKEEQWRTVNASRVTQHWLETVTLPASDFVDLRNACI